jgi:hypothetical protein
LPSFSPVSLQKHNPISLSINRFLRKHYRKFFRTRPVVLKLSKMKRRMQIASAAANCSGSSRLMAHWNNFD